ncbi:unnamed protein product, partial [Prorocentrum cordatum]
VVSHRGILPGCRHANAMLRVLFTRVIAKMRRIYACIQPRVLMDDSSFQWMSRRLCESEVLLASVRRYCAEVYKLGLILQ